MSMNALARFLCVQRMEYKKKNSCITFFIHINQVVDWQRGTLIHLFHLIMPIFHSTNEIFYKKNYQSNTKALRLKFRSLTCPYEGNCSTCKCTSIQYTHSNVFVCSLTDYEKFVKKKQKFPFIAPVYREGRELDDMIFFLVVI